MTPVLRLRGLTKRFGAVSAMTDVNLDVNPGEVVALVGDNGAGKSTVIKAIAGVQPADHGTVEWMGRQVAITRPQEAVALGIATVYQDLALCDNLDVVANLFLGRESVVAAGKPVGWLNEVDMERQSGGLLQQLSVKIPSIRTKVASLSGGQRQSVAIARSLLGDPQLVLLDEPTAALGVAQTAQVLDLINRLKERGLAVLVISHNLADVFAVTDRVEVLRLGHNSGTFDVATSSREQVVAAITGADLDLDGTATRPAHNEDHPAQTSSVSGDGAERTEQS